MKKFISIMLTAIILMSTLSTMVFATDVNSYDIIVKGTSLAPYFELNGKTAFCISPDAVRPQTGMSYTYGEDTQIPEIEAAVIAAETYEGELTEKVVYQVLQMVIWEKLSEKGDYRNKTRKLLGQTAQKLFDEFVNFEKPENYSVTFEIYDTTEKIAGYQTIATYDVVFNEVKEEIEETVNYTVNYYFNDELINTQNCVQDETYVFADLPETEEGYVVTGWTSEDNISYEAGNEFVNLSETNEAVINLYAKSTPITYIVNYFVDDELVETKECKYGETYNYEELPSTFSLRETVNFDGWYDEAEVSVIPGAEFSNLTNVDGEEFNFYAYSKVIEATPATYTVNYWFNNEIINSQICTENISETFISLPEAEAGYIVKGWTDVNGTEYVAGEEFVNLTTENNAVIDLYATTSPIEYKVNYYIDNEFVESIDCIYGETYNHKNLFNRNTLTTQISYDGWYNDNQETAIPGSEFSNLSNINGSEVNFYAYKNVITVPTPDPEPIPEPFRYTVRYWVNGELIGLQDIPEDLVSTFMELPTVENGYVIDGWTDADGNRYREGDEFRNLCDEDGATFDLYAEINPIVYRVNYYFNEEVVASTSCVYDETYFFEEIIEIEGYTITGWDNKYGVLYNPGEAFENLSDVNGSIVNLYAIASPIRYNVDYYLDNTLIDSIECVYNEEYIYSDLPVVDNYIVSGWSNDNGDIFMEGDSFSNLASVDDDTISLYATSEEIVIEEPTTEEPTTVPEIEVLGTNDELPEEPTTEETTTEEPTTKVEVLGTNDELPTEEETTTAPSIEVLGENEEIYIPNTGDNDTVIVASITLVVSMIAIAWVILSSRSKKETV